MSLNPVSTNSSCQTSLSEEGFASYKKEFQTLASSFEIFKDKSLTEKEKIEHWRNQVDKADQYLKNQKGYIKNRPHRFQDSILKHAITDMLKRKFLAKNPEFSIDVENKKLPSISNSEGFFPESCFFTTLEEVISFLQPLINVPREALQKGLSCNGQTYNFNICLNGDEVLFSLKDIKKLEFVPPHGVTFTIEDGEMMFVCVGFADLIKMVHMIYFYLDQNISLELNKKNDSLDGKFFLEKIEEREMKFLAILKSLKDSYYKKIFSCAFTICAALPWYLVRRDEAKAEFEKISQEDSEEGRAIRKSPYYPPHGDFRNMSYILMIIENAPKRRDKAEDKKLYAWAMEIVPYEYEKIGNGIQLLYWNAIIESLDKIKISS